MMNEKFHRNIAFSVRRAEKYGLHAAILYEYLMLFLQFKEIEKDNSELETWLKNKEFSLRKELPFFTDKQFHSSLKIILENKLLDECFR